MSRFGRLPDSYEQTFEAIEGYVRVGRHTDLLDEMDWVTNSSGQIALTPTQEERARFVVDSAAMALGLKLEQTELEAERLELEARLGEVASRSEIIDARLREMQLGPSLSPDEDEVNTRKLLETTTAYDYFELLRNQPGFRLYVGPNDLNVPPYTDVGRRYYIQQRVNDLVPNCLNMTGRMMNAFREVGDEGMTGASFKRDENGELVYIDVVEPEAWIKAVAEQVPGIRHRATKGLLAIAYLQRRYLEDKAA